MKDLKLESKKIIQIDCSCRFNKLKNFGKEFKNVISEFPGAKNPKENLFSVEVS